MDNAALIRLGVGLAIMAGCVFAIWLVVSSFIKPKLNLQPVENIQTTGQGATLSLTWTDPNKFYQGSYYQVTLANASSTLFSGVKVPAPTTALSLFPYIDNIDTKDSIYTAQIQIITQDGQFSPMAQQKVSLASSSFLPVLPQVGNRVVLSLNTPGCTGADGTGGPFILPQHPIYNSTSPDLIYGCFYTGTPFTAWLVKSAGGGNVGFVNVNSMQAITVDVASGNLSLTTTALDPSAPLPPSCAFQIVPNTDGTVSLLSVAAQKFVKGIPNTSCSQFGPICGVLNCQSAQQDPGMQMDRFWMTYSSA
jgi:hypothetical protein